MSISVQSYARALYEAAAHKSKTEVASLVDALMAELEAKRELAQAPLLIKEIERLDDEREGRLRVHITSAHRLDEAALKRIEKLLCRQTGCKEVVWSKEVDSSLLGGIEVRYGDTVVDMSLKQSIQSLSQAIKQ